MGNKLGQYTSIMTEDGSQTLYSEHYQEACHSTSGARQETITHYIEGCKLLDKCENHNPVFILEIGFGTGIGFQETLKFFKTKSCKLHYISLEIDPYLVERFSRNENITLEQKGNTYLMKTDAYTLEIVTGDARKTIKTLSAYKFHAIYQDAFSPKKNADLWTVEWFQDLRKLAHNDCHMSTYSSSSSIRKSMLKAGWSLFKGAKFGPKRSSTRAALTGESDPDILLQLERSPAPIITDANFEDYQKGNLS